MEIGRSVKEAAEFVSKLREIIEEGNYVDEDFSYCQNTAMKLWNSWIWGSEGFDK